MPRFLAHLAVLVSLLLVQALALCHGHGMTTATSLETACVDVNPGDCDGNAPDGHATPTGCESHAVAAPVNLAALPAFVLDAIDHRLFTLAAPSACLMPIATLPPAAPPDVGRALPLLV